MCIGLTFVPVAGVALGALCGVSLIVDNVFYEYGYCSRYTFTLVLSV